MICTVPDSVGSLQETWSDAARAASIAARQAAAKGKDWRKAAAAAFIAKSTQDQRDKDFARQVTRSLGKGKLRPVKRWEASSVNYASP